MSDASKFDRLTDGQKECLRLVFQGYETKAIAPLVGLSVDGVNARLKAAMKIVGATRRSEAARLLAAHEGGYQQQVYPPLVVPSADGGRPNPPAFMVDAAEADGGSMLAVSEERTLYEGSAVRRRWRLRWPFPTRGRVQNDLTVIEGLIWIVVGTAILAIAAATILNAYTTLTMLWRGTP